MPNNLLSYQEDFGELDFILSLHRASDNYLLCEKFVWGHRQLLAVNDVDLGPVDTSWFNSTGVFLLVVRRADADEILGGARKSLEIMGCHMKFKEIIGGPRKCQEVQGSHRKS